MSLRILAVGFPQGKECFFFFKRSRLKTGSFYVAFQIISYYCVLWITILSRPIKFFRRKKTDGPFRSEAYILFLPNQVINSILIAERMLCLAYFFKNAIYIFIYLLFFQTCYTFVSSTKVCLTRACSFSFFQRHQMYAYGAKTQTKNSTFYFGNHIHDSICLQKRYWMKV